MFWRWGRGGCTEARSQSYLLQLLRGLNSTLKVAEPSKPSWKAGCKSYHVLTFYQNAQEIMKFKKLYGRSFWRWKMTLHWKSFIFTFFFPFQIWKYMLYFAFSKRSILITKSTLFTDNSQQLRVLGQEMTWSISQETLRGNICTVSEFESQIKTPYPQMVFISSVSNSITHMYGVVNS